MYIDLEQIDQVQRAAYWGKLAVTAARQTLECHSSEYLASLAKQYAATAATLAFCAFPELREQLELNHYVADRKQEIRMFGQFADEVMKND